MIDPEVVVRAAVPADAAEVRAVVTAAFDAEEGEVGVGAQVADLVTALDAAGATRASLVAVLDGVVAGHVQLTRAWVDARERLVEVLVLSPLSVLPERQRAGIGAGLVATAVEAARGLGAPALFLEGSPTYYGAQGFQPARGHGFERPSTRIPDPAFQVVLLDAHEAWMQGRLVYPEPFWSHDAVGLRDPGLAEVERLLGDA